MVPGGIPASAVDRRRWAGVRIELARIQKGQFYITDPQDSSRRTVASTPRELHGARAHRCAHVSFSGLHSPSCLSGECNYVVFPPSIARHDKESVSVKSAAPSQMYPGKAVLPNVTNSASTRTDSFSFSISIIGKFLSPLPGRRDDIQIFSVP
jgi:hypothetical protein